MTESNSRWHSASGARRGADYDERWARLEAAGHSIHGEADFICAFEPASVLDAGCGTGRVAIELAARGIDVVGDLAYVAVSEQGMQIIEVSNPAAPAALGNIDTPGYAEDVQVVGDLAYIADTGGGLFHSQIDLYWGEDEPRGPWPDTARAAACELSVQWIVPVMIVR